MAPYATHLRAAVLDHGAASHRSRRTLGDAAREIGRRVWVPLWFATAIGLTWGAIELVTRGIPVVSIGGP